MSDGSTVIIGSGIIGLLCGYELRKRGARVVILDKCEPARACSAFNAGWIVPSFSQPLPSPGVAWTSLKWMLRHDSPFYISPRALFPLTSWLLRFLRHCNKRDYKDGLEALAKLNKRTMANYDLLKQEGLDFEMHESGLLFVFLSQTAMRRALADYDVLEGHGYPQPRPLLREELHELEPELSDEVCSGFWVQSERHVRPEMLNKELLKRLGELGVEIRAHVEVLGGVCRHKRVTAVTTNQGLISGDQFLIAAGSWSGILAKKFGINVPLQAGKGYSITVDHPRIRVRRPVYFSEAKTACTPFANALRIAGTMELSGINSKFDARRVATIQRAASRYLRGFSPVGGQREWMGLRPITPDGLPVIGRAPGFNNLYIAAGHAMLGLTLAPETARAISDLIYSGTTDVDLSPFDPGRFSR
jgi:D-amino-acid dehydrogenase